jgi:WD40 repeat protein
LLRTLRVPIGEGDEGKVYAVALSPDGKWVGAGGWSKNDDVFVFEAATGRLIMRLGRLGAVINHLAFSPDGSRLVSVFSGGEGMRLWETGSWRLLAEDKNYSGKESYGAVFDGANRLYTVADDGQIRRYDANGSLERKAATKGGKQPFSIALHPNGVKLAIGSTRAPWNGFTPPIQAASPWANRKSPGPPMAHGFLRAAKHSKRLSQL